ncbi:unnamed protein product [Medioppia subpectinata]|uniref:dynamin GTPase n=1 Tax=Medioppia subpectinata TaxID=1979941 RepID=A0A7R9KWA1_9ACAR|nr:unnamed protein product [Medioppia subpectinata]CAG2109665.1 unnamed protein product [Medioppia subpectinata]
MVLTMIWTFIETLFYTLFLWTIGIALLATIVHNRNNIHRLWTRLTRANSTANIFTNDNYRLGNSSGDLRVTTSGVPKTPRFAANLIQIVNELQDKLKGTVALDLPQIVVVGGQSSGKSSVLESIVGRDFLPRGSGIVTRRPLVLQLISDKTNTKDFGEFDHFKGKKFYDFNEIRDEITAETNREVPESAGISSNPITLKIYSSKVLDLTLVDLPGMTRVAVGNQPKDIEDRIERMILKYIRGDNCLILAVTAANQDLATSDALKLAGKVDPEGDRTIGVLTKLDLMDEGTDARDILTGNHKIQLKRGFVGVVLRSQKDIEANKDMKKALAAEQRFFEDNPSYGPELAKTAGNGNEVNVKQLTCGARINVLMCDTFAKEVDDLDTDDDSMGREIAIAIQNAFGSHLGIFIPDDAFTACVVSQMELFRKPSIVCVDWVTEEMVKTVNTCIDDIHCFPNLKQIFSRLTLDFIRECNKKCKSFVNHFIDTEKCFVNTINEDFLKLIGDVKSKPIADAQLKVSAEMVDQNSKCGWIDYNNNDHWFVLKGTTLFWFKNESQTDKMGSIDLKGAQFNAKIGNDCIVALILPKRINNEFELVFHSSEEALKWRQWLEEAGVKRYLFQVRAQRNDLDQMPFLMSGSQLSLNDPNEDMAYPDYMVVQVEEVKRLINAYITVLKKHIKFVLKSLEKLKDNLAFDLPQIVVIGEQSSGKSSVLESFVGHEFLPRGTAFGEFLHSSGKRFESFKEIRDEITAETDREVTESTGVSAKPINLKIYSPDVLDLTLVDLPGLTKVPVGSQPQDIEDRIQKLVLKYIRGDNCLILAVTAANQDLATSGALKLAESVNPSGDRTIAVLTKLDLMDKGTDARDILNGKYDTRLNRCFIGVVNRSQKDIKENKDITKALTDESKFFAKHPAYGPEMAKRCGIKYLQEYLQQELSNHISRKLRALKSKLHLKLSETNDKLEKMKKRLTEDNREVFLSENNYQFLELFKSSMGGKVWLVNVTELSGGSKIKEVMNDTFAQNVDEIMCDQNGLNDEIVIAIHNSFGSRIGHFTPDAAFNSCVIKQIENFRKPALDCVDLVTNEIIETINKCTEEMQTYEEIRDKIRFLTIEFIHTSNKKCKEFVERFVETEKCYPSKCDYDDLVKQIGSEEKIASIADVPLKVAAHMVQQTIPKGISELVAVVASSAGDIDMTSNAGDKDMATKVDEVKRLVNAYIVLIKKNFKDQLPKICQYDLIDSTCKYIGTKLLEQLRKEFPSIDDIIGDDPNKAIRIELQNQKQQYIEGIDIIEKFSKLKSMPAMSSASLLRQRLDESFNIQTHKSNSDKELRIELMNKKKEYIEAIAIMDKYSKMRL